MNQKKYVLCLTLSIISIVINSLVILLLLISMPVILAAEYLTNSTGIIITVLLFGLAIYAAALVLSILLCIKTKKRSNVKGLLITFIVIYALCIFSLIVNASTIETGASPLSFILYGGLLALSCVAVAIKDYPAEKLQSYIGATVQTDDNSIDAKIKELKRLKELMIITDEQYEDAVKKLIDKEVQS